MRLFSANCLNMLIKITNMLSFDLTNSLLIVTTLIKFKCKNTLEEYYIGTCIGKYLWNGNQEEVNQTQVWALHNLNNFDEKPSFCILPN